MIYRFVDMCKVTQVAEAFVLVTGKLSLHANG